MDQSKTATHTETPSSTISKTLTVPCAHGIHLRVASRIVTLAQGLQSEVWLSSDTRSANAKSILGMLELGAVQGTPLTITAHGSDAKRAVQAIEGLFNAVRPCAS